MEQVILPFVLACHDVFWPLTVFRHLSPDCIQLWQCYQDPNNLLLFSVNGPFGMMRLCQT